LEGRWWQGEGFNLVEGGVGLLNGVRHQGTLLVQGPRDQAHRIAIIDGQGVQPLVAHLALQNLLHTSGIITVWPGVGVGGGVPTSACWLILPRLVFSEHRTAVQKRAAYTGLERDRRGFARLWVG